MPSPFMCIKLWFEKGFSNLKNEKNWVFENDFKH